MTTLDVVVTAKRMLRSTPFHRATKAPEQLYYVLLFSTDPAYARADVWRTWLEMGLALGIKDPPPGAASADQLAWTVSSNGATTTVRLASPRRDVMEGLAAVLRSIEGLRPSLAGKDEDARAGAILESKPIADRLTAPAEKALARARLRRDESESIMGVVRRAALALADDQIVSVALRPASAAPARPAPTGTRGSGRR